MKVTLIRHTENPIDAIESAASNCYDSIPTGGGIMKYCYEHGHHSVLEFAEFHFHIEGVSRALTHQLVRHRLASYAQRSQRYVKEDGFTYAVPKSVSKVSVDLFGDGRGGFTYEEMVSLINDFYCGLLNVGVPEEDARYILPNACHTVIDMKLNLRTLINLCNERLCERAQWEIKQLIKLIVAEVIKVEPRLGFMLVPKCENHINRNSCPESIKEWCKRQPHFTELLIR